MADPISIAASVVTLVKTSRMVGSGITKLLALKHAPDILSTSIHSYERLHHSAIKLDTLLSHNAGLGQSLSRRLCGMEIQLERLAGHVASPGKNSRGISQQHMTHEPVKPRVMNSEDLVNNPALDQNIHNSPPLIIQTRVLLKRPCDEDLAAEDKYGSVPEHCLLFDNVSTNLYSQRPLILDRARSPNDNSTYELLGEPALQAFYRQSGNSELRAAAAFADAETLQILKAVKWISVDIEHLLNHRSCIYWTTRQLSEKRRSGERFPASEPEPDEDPEQIYQSFMSLLQKIIDDHYGLEGHETNSTHCRYTRRMVLIPRKDTKRYWDIVEKDVHVDRDISEVESDDEAWADAPEQPIGQQATL
ncbi:MAG: hypothetical protein Q9228_004352 [Teloschistes exilis]